MARTKTEKKDSAATARGKEKVPFKGYINWSMSMVDVKQFEEWRTHYDAFEDLVPKLLQGEYTLKFSHDFYNSADVAGLYCQDPRNENAGWNLTARGGSAAEALYRLLFVHFVCFEERWPDEYVRHDNDWT